MLTLRTTLLFHFLIQALPQLVGCKDWTATLPGSLRAVRDSCLVIPCMFQYPGQPSPRSDLAGIWYQEDAIFYHSANPAFQDRAQLVGDLGAQNCSLWIKRIRSEDAKTYKFRVEIQSLDKFTFHAQVTVYVKKSPARPEISGYRSEITEGESVSLECKTTHTCTKEPPTIVWRPLYGTTKVSERALGDGRWEVLSRHVFTASHLHHGKQMTCEVRYFHGPRSDRTTQHFNISYAPKNTTVSVNEDSRTVREGSNASLTCSAESNPPVASYTWYEVLANNITLTLPETGPVLVISRIPNDLLSYYCLARNQLGSQNSSMLHLDIQYTPNILPESDCKFRRQLFECSCVVQSNPPPFIRWHLPDRNLSAADGEFSFHSSVAGHMTRSHLKGTASFETSITCSASNSEGVAQLVLPNHADTMWNVLASVLPSGFLVLAITAAAAACRHQRTKVAQAGEKPKDITPKKVPNEDVLKNAPVDGPGSVDLYANVLSSADCKDKGNTIDSNIMYLERLYQMVLPARDQDSVYHNC